MEKRLVVFLLCSVLIMTGYGFLRVQLAPPQPVAEKPDDKKPDDKKPGDEKPGDEKPGDEKPGDEKPGDEKAGDETGEKTGDKKTSKPDETKQKDGGGTEKTLAGKDLPGEATPDTKSSADGKPEIGAGEQDDTAKPVKPLVPQQWVTLGSFAPGSPNRILVTLNNRGAAVERVELVERRENGLLRYRDLTEKSGYLGLQCWTTDEGCEVKVVGPGTPAALAKPKDGTMASGIIAQDVIEEIDGSKIRSLRDFEPFIKGTKPKQVIKLRVRRRSGDTVKTVEFTATLDYRPLELVQPESDPGTRPVLSYLLGLYALGQEETEFGEDELPGYMSLRNSHWQVSQEKKNEVVFRQRIKVGKDKGELEFIKRYRLDQARGKDGEINAKAYALRMAVEIVNHTAEAQTVAYGLDGPTGLPIEGWWYSNKIHPAWGAAGARDVIWRVHGNRHSLRSATQIYKQAKDEEAGSPITSVLADQPTAEQRTLDYIGVDTQYFSAVLMAGSFESPKSFTCQDAFAMPVGAVSELRGREVKTLNTTFRFVSPVAKIESGSSFEKDYHLFLGPKSTELLTDFGLTDIIEYGWFGWIAKPLSKLLHFFYALVFNYGLAIVLLTVLVRGLMFPIGRKAARNAQMMQELAPEIKKIKEKYKNDLEKQTQAQRELWKKHNFNPLGGCWLMFLQLPIFIGLYRCLSVDIELRQAPLIPGLEWCSNLAGPDMAVYWENFMPGFMAAETGWLGPYLNVLPIVTIALFIAQQKMFTPPATDDQTRMQQNMMKYMMVFMGFLFFKVASGLCLYFIASSLWGIAERKLLPKPAAPKKGPESSSKPDAPKQSPPPDKKKSLVQRLKEKSSPPETEEEKRARRKKRRK